MVLSTFDIEKAKSAVLFVVHKLDKADFMHVFKIVYFAEQQHLANYGSPILGDNFIAMANGPVPSRLYDLFKCIRDNGYKSKEASIFYEGFEVKENHFIEALQAADVDYLSQSEIECLSKSTEICKPLTFPELKKRSHDAAWEKASSEDNEIDMIVMAQVGGANAEMLKYIIQSFENHNTMIC